MVTIITAGCSVVDDAGRVAAKVPPLIDDAGRVADNVSPFIDDAGRVADNVSPFIDDAGRVADNVSPLIDDAGRVADNVPPLIGGLSELDERAAYNAVSRVLSTKADDTISRSVDTLTPEQKEKLREAFISSSCWYLTSSYYGYAPDDQQIAAYISEELVKYFVFEDSEYADLLVDIGKEYVKASFESINDEGIDDDKVRDFCGQFK
jgi:hypothetical protein